MANTDMELKMFNQVVDVMLTGGYTPSVLTDFLVKGLENLRKIDKEGIFPKNLSPDPSVVQLKVLESFATMHEILQPKKPARAGQGERQVAVERCVERKGRPQTPPPADIVMAETAPPQSNNKRKIVSEEDEPEQTPGETERLADEFLSRLNMGDESTGPSTKRLKTNTSNPKLFRSHLVKNLARRAEERKSLDKTFQLEKWEEWDERRRAQCLSSSMSPQAGCRTTLTDSANHGSFSCGSPSAAPRIPRNI